ncbi:response regulator [Oligoflexus tunisiensis]|uniref:response regulator n=1 Tax=Oligoflexus tunisiensis TaxID=708132 RepID=UPI000ADFA3E7|nr:response regulator [Oligoflexus tunisiensis]
MTYQSEVEATNILLVDDIPANLIALEAILKRPDYRLVSVTSGREAFEKMMHEEFAVILLDVMMPEMDGFEFARLVRETELVRITPIIFVTAAARETFARGKGYALGAADYLVKPLDTEEVKAKVSVFVELYRSKRALAVLNRELEKRASEKARELAASNERFRLFVEGVTDYGFIQMDSRGRFITWNAGAERLLGYAENEIIGLPFEKIFTLEDVEAKVPERELAIARQRGRADDTRWHQKKDGSRFWAHGITTALLEPDGTVRGFAKVLRDYTAAKCAEDRLKESENRFRMMAEASPQIVWTAEQSGTVDYINRRWFDFTGTPEYTDSGKWVEAIHPDDRSSTEAAWRAALDSSGLFENEHRLRRRDGMYHWFLSRAVALYNGNGKVYRWLGTSTDIDEQKRHQEELSRAREQADAANHAKSTFLANMSHEIRTPLNAILGFTDLLLRPNLDDEERKEFAATVRRNSSLLSQLIDDILDLSKVESGKLVIESIPCSLTNLLSDVRAVLSQQAREKKIQFVIRSDGLVPDRITTDPTRLKQILLNLVGNAIKFASEGCVEVLVKMDSHSGKDGSSKILFVVKDTGCGISKEGAQLLFQPFSQADASTTRKFGGTGLGLVLSRHLARSMGGDVVLTESEPEAGSTFTVTIDPGTTNGSTEIQELSREQKACSQRDEEHPKRLNGINVLVVEDSPDSQRLLGRVLQRNGASVEIATDGQQAVEKAVNGHFDAILMDMQMPVQDGLEATAELRRRGYRRPIIALTAHAMREEREKALRAGCDDHLTKPIDMGELVMKVFEFSQKRGKFAGSQLPH